MHLITTNNTVAGVSGHIGRCIIVDDSKELLDECQRFSAETGADLSQIAVFELTGPKYHMMLTIAELGPDLEDPIGQQAPQLGR
jgi:hypothetical protein